MAAPHTLPVNYTELQNQHVGCVRYARGWLIDGLLLYILTLLKLTLSDGIKNGRLKTENALFQTL